MNTEAGRALLARRFHRHVRANRLYHGGWAVSSILDVEPEVAHAPALRPTRDRMLADRQRARPSGCLDQLALLLLRLQNPMKHPEPLMLSYVRKRFAWPGNWTCSR